MKKKISTFINILVGFVVLAAVALLSLYIVNRIQDSDKKISSLKADLESKEGELEAANAYIAELTDPVKEKRDEKRKNDLERLSVLMKEYKANNAMFPTTLPSVFNEDFVGPYVDSLNEFVDPDTELKYQITPVANVQTPPGVVIGTMQYQWPGKCTGSEFSDDATQDEAAVRVLLETGDIHCLNVE